MPGDWRQQDDVGLAPVVIGQLGIGLGRCAGQGGQRHERQEHLGRTRRRGGDAKAAGRTQAGQQRRRMRQRRRAIDNQQYPTGQHGISSGQWTVDVSGR